MMKIQLIKRRKMDLIINAKGEVLTKDDGKLQATVRFMDPETGDIHKLLLFINKVEKPMAKTTRDGKKYGDITHFISGVHKGKKSVKDAKDKMVKFAETTVKHNFESKTVAKVEKKAEVTESPF